MEAKQIYIANGVSIYKDTYRDNTMREWGGVYCDSKAKCLGTYVNKLRAAQVYDKAKLRRFKYSKGYNISLNNIKVGGVICIEIP